MHPHVTSISEVTTVATYFCPRLKGRGLKNCLQKNAGKRRPSAENGGSVHGEHEVLKYLIWGFRII
jgi:hypothetical protein